MRPPHSTKSLRLVVALCAVVTIAVFAASFRDALHHPGLDLRAKVVGARLLAAHQNPYPTAPYRAHDPYFRFFKFNTYSPALLAFYIPASPLRYPAQRLLYFALDWLLVATLFFLSRTWFPPTARAHHAALFTLFLLADFALRVHMDSGQYYLLLATLLAVVITSWRSRTRPAVIGYAALSAILLIRPTYVILLAVFWLLGMRRQALRTAGGAALLMAVLLTAFGITPWIRYFQALSMVQRGEIRAIFPPYDLPAPPAPSTANTASSRSISTVEGTDFAQKFPNNYLVSRTSISVCALQNSTRPVCARLTRSPAVFTVANTAALCLAAIYCLWMAHRLRARPLEIKLAFAFLTPILIETFGPQRYAYTDVTLVPTLLLLSGFLLRVQPNLLKLYSRAIAAFVAICLLSSIAPYVLSLTHKPIMFVSLARWAALLLFTNAVFLYLARHPRALCIGEPLDVGHTTPLDAEDGPLLNRVR